MSYLNQPYENNFKELCSCMPLFYLDLFEMREILKAQGRLMDGVCAAFEQIIDDNFILRASEETIAAYEESLELTPDAGMSLEERRKVVIATMYRTPHIGEPEIRDIFHIFCGGSIEVDFYTGNIELRVDIGEGEFLNVPGFLAALKRQIPAHLSLAVVFESRVGIVVSTTGRGYKHRSAPTGIPRAGTLPQRNTVGAPYDGPITIETQGRGYGYSAPEAGTKPQRDTLAGIEHSAICIDETAQGFGYKAPATDTDVSGTHPGRSTAGGLGDSAITMEAEAGGHPYGTQAAGTAPYRNITEKTSPWEIDIDAGTQEFGYSSGMTGRSAAGKSPARSTFFDETESSITASTEAHGRAYAVAPTGIPSAGTKPAQATQGGLQAGEIGIDTSAKGFPYSVQGAGKTDTGKAPYTDTGASARGGAFYAVAEVESYRYTVSLCGLSYCNRRSIRR